MRSAKGPESALKRRSRTLMGFCYGLLPAAYFSDNRPGRAGNKNVLFVGSGEYLLKGELYRLGTADHGVLSGSYSW